MHALEEAAKQQATDYVQRLVSASIMLGKLTSESHFWPAVTSTGLNTKLARTACKQGLRAPVQEVDKSKAAVPARLPVVCHIDPRHGPEGGEQILQGEGGQRRQDSNESGRLRQTHLYMKLTNAKPRASPVSRS